MGSSLGPRALFASASNTKLIEECARIITVSHYLKDFIKSGSGFDSQVMPFPAYGAGPWPVFSNFDRGSVTLVNASAVKGISIFMALARKLPQTEFATVPAWATTKEDLRQLAGFANVQVLEPDEDIDQILAGTRVLLAPSLVPEAFGMIAVEAMLRGIPVIASNAGGLREAKLGIDYVLPVMPIERHASGFDERRIPAPIVPAQDIVPWEQALRKLLEDREHYIHLAKASRAAALEFVSHARVESFENCFSDVLQASGRRNFQKPPSKTKSVSKESLDARLTPERRALLALRTLKNTKKNDPAR
jgi:glycosyltransferase involved in cell wall biosynthesis